jgi:hypothetical protein
VGKQATAKANTGISPLRRKERAFGRDDKLWGGEKEHTTAKNTANLVDDKGRQLFM